jgi:PKD repeat protein
MEVMKTRYATWAVALLAFLNFYAPAATLYVSLNSTNPVPPYADWSTAAINIQDAIDASTNGDFILVNDGIYAAGGRVVYGALTNRIVINKAVTVQSVNGPAVTVIQGNPVPGDNAVRCVYMTNNATLIGFTITNGATRSAGDATGEQSAGGIYCESNDDFIVNCVLAANVAQNNAGGIYQGTLTNCIVRYNSCGSFNVGVGGGAWNSVLVNCTVTGNSAGHFGGAAYGSTLDNCTLDGNSAVIGGAAHTCLLRDCVLADNSGVAYGGGAYGSSLTNCLVLSNTVSCSYCGFSAGIGGGANSCSLDNCTIVGNYANWYAGGVDSASQVNNCIVYYNTSASAADANYQSGMALNYSCTTPLPAGPGNITNVPLFLNLTGDFHLQSSSPCINVGNNAYVGITNDLDGNARIVGDGVDMGAYEYPTSIPLTVMIQAGTTNIDTGSPLSLQGVLQGGTASMIVWDFGDGTTTTNQLSVSHVWMLPGIYPVTLIVSNEFTPGGASATVTINASNAPPTILEQPANQFSVLFSNVTLNVNASGSWPLTYQWQFEGANLRTATNASLTLTNLQLSSEGTYNVIVSNAFGSVTSSNAFLSISRIVIWGSSSNQPPGLTNVMSITGYPAALRRDGTVVWWTGSLSTPITVYGLSNVVAFATSYNYESVALQNNGNVVLWTSDGASRLSGSGSSNAVAITGYNYGDLELRSNGTLVGSALSGAPLNVANLSNAVAVAEGFQHSLALKADGTVLAWGNNSYGQATVPSGLSNVIAIAAGGDHSLALKNDGTVTAWGWNSYGQTNVPPGLSNVIAIAAGGDHSLALKNDGTVTAWGWNNYGQTNVPTGLSNAIMIAAGQYDSLALVGNGPPMTQAWLMNPVAGSNSFNLTLPTQSGRVYALEFKRQLTDTNWTAVPLIFGNGTNRVLTDSTATNSQRFYRVRRW